MAMTPSDLDEIRKRCEAAPDVIELVMRGNGYLSYSDPSDEAKAFYRAARTDVVRLLDEVERLQRENGEGHRIVQSLVMEKQTIHRVLSESNVELRQRLSLLEPVWEAAKVVHEIRQRMDTLDDPHFDALDNEFGDAVTAMGLAIDAAVAKEGR